MKAAVVLALALLAHAQSNATNSSQVVTLTSFSVFPTLGPDRQVSTVSSAIVFTTTLASNNTVSGNSTAGNNTAGNNTVSTNSTASSNSSSSSTSTTPLNLPTAPTAVAAGGGPNGAPLPGASGGAYGPDDKYIAAASTLVRNSILVGVGGLLLSGALIVL